jgi:hypothetical protein
VTAGMLQGTAPVNILADYFILFVMPAANAFCLLLS